MHSPKLSVKVSQDAWYPGTLTNKKVLEMHHGACSKCAINDEEFESSERYLCLSKTFQETGI